MTAMMAMMSILAITVEIHVMNISVAEIRNNLADALDRVAYQGERVVLQRRGKGVAALVSMDDLARSEAMETQEDLRAAKRARREKGGVTLDELKVELGL